MSGNDGICHFIGYHGIRYFYCNHGITVTSVVVTESWSRLLWSRNHFQLSNNQGIIEISRIIQVLSDQ